ncbi:MAG TPA: TIGR01777 family oxidoreductase [Thermoanaerobaculia bacterium]|nr:TIGR01777 family oxidoreductase [Thermoanaerobaculia bacterium]
MRVIVTGGTGFIGPGLCERLVARGHDVIALTRDASRSRDHVHPKVRVASWAEGAAWEGFVDGAGALVNLAGETIAQRWTAAARRRIAESRLNATSRLKTAAEKAAQKPGVLVNASAVGYYGPRGDEILDESAAAGDGFLAKVCVDGEEAARSLEPLGVRVARLRTGVVLGAGGGALAKMLPPFRAFLGGPLGSGAQWMSWIHTADLVELYVLAVENPAVSGPLNATAPNPVTMREFATALGRALHRPSFVKVPAAAIRLALGDMASVVLEGARVVPKKALDNGFTFRFTDVFAALRDVVGD